MQSEIILNQILILGVLVIVGVAGSVFGVLNENVKESLAKIIFNITLPLMMLTNFSRVEVTPRLLVNSFSMVWLSLAVMMFMLFMGWLGSVLLRLKRDESAIFRTHSVFGNIIYLGFPVVYALFGDEGLLYASMLQLVSNFLMWTVGVVILSSGNGTPVGKSMLKVLNINTLAIVLGLIMFLTGIRLPGFLMKSLGGLGSSNTYLSMIYIGVMLYHSNIRGMLGNRVVYFLTFNKLLVIPLLLVGIYSLFTGLTGVESDKLVMSVLIVESSMPCMANIVILAKVFGADERLAAANVFVSTILSIITLPLILYVLSMIF
ncbi:MAG: AEC family transporter [Bacteroidales bacterium]|nr:AEC family transporter [Bacteroidales bacterium]